MKRPLAWSLVIALVVWHGLRSVHTPVHTDPSAGEPIAALLNRRAP